MRASSICSRSTASGSSSTTRKLIGSAIFIQRQSEGHAVAAARERTGLAFGGVPEPRGEAVADIGEPHAGAAALPALVERRASVILDQDDELTALLAGPDRDVDRVGGPGDAVLD